MDVPYLPVVIRGIDPDVGDRNPETARRWRDLIGLLSIGDRSVQDAAFCLHHFETVKASVRARSPWYEKAACRLSARGFVGALNTLGEVLEELARIEPTTASSSAQFGAQFPDVRPMRNSIQHVGERVHGLGQCRTTAAPEIVHVPADPFGGPAHVAEAFPADVWERTGADARGRVEISRATLDAAVAIYQMALDAMRWRDERRSWL
jgi:hypothetical protein